MKTCTLILMLILAGSAFSQNLEYSDYVNDFANILPDEKEQELNAKLSKFEKQTTIEFTIVTVRSLEGEEVSTFTNELFRKWGVGKADKNNGLMILIAPNERKWRIEVGYGLEEYLTDGYTKVTAEENFPSHFKENDYYGGLLPVVDDFIFKMGKMSWSERLADIEKRKKEAAESKVFWFTVLKTFLGFIAGLIVFLFVLRYHRKLKQSRYEREQSLIQVISDIKNYISSFRKKVYLFHDKPFIDSSEWKRILHVMEEMVMIPPSEIEDAKLLLNRIKISGEYHIKEMNDAEEKLKEFDACIQYINRDYLEMRRDVLELISRFRSKNSTARYSSTLDYEEISLVVKRSEELFDAMGQTVLSFENLEAVSKLHKESLNALRLASKTVNSAVEEIDSFEKAYSYVISHEALIKARLKKMEESINKPGVKETTIQKASTVRELALSFNPLYEQSEITGSYNRLSSILNRIDRIISEAAHEVMERKRRESSRNSRYHSRTGAYIGSSSSSSFGSSNDYSSSSGGGFDFGGGDSGGGGSDGGW